MKPKNNTHQKRVLSLLVGRDDGIVKPYFGIIYKNNLWLVTAWLINKATEFATPERMIRVDSFQESADPKFDYENILLPKAVIEGTSQDVLGYEVLSLPDEPVVSRDKLYQLPKIFE